MVQVVGHEGGVDAQSVAVTTDPDPEFVPTGRAGFGGTDRLEGVLCSESIDDRSDVEMGVDDAAREARQYLTTAMDKLDIAVA